MITISMVTSHEEKNQENKSNILQNAKEYLIKHAKS